jgi:uncharacterized protein
MNTWQQRTLSYTLFLLVAGTLVGLKYNIPFFVQLASSFGLNSALVEETMPAINPSFQTPSFLTLKTKAETGDPQACLLVARMYKMSAGGDVGIANQWYLKAAEAGQSHAQFYLGGNYFSGTEGLPQDTAKAIYWSEKSAEQGVVLAQFNVANMYEQEKNMTKAIYWYEKAVAQVCPEAMGNLANIYEYGTGTAKNIQKAHQLRKKSADLGIKEAQYKLGYDFLVGEDGATRDYHQARHYLELAAQQGDAYAQKNLGMMYEYGEGTGTNKPEAVHWYKQSADLNNTVGMERLARMYEAGEGITKDRAKAFYWYEKSATAGDSQTKVAMANRYFADANRGPSKYFQGGYWLMLSYFELFKQAETPQSTTT